ELTERGTHRLSELERAGCVVERRAHVAPASEHFCQIAVDPPEELARLEFACQLGAALEGRCALVEAFHLHQRLAPDQKEEDVRHDSENVRTGLRIREGEHERFIRDGQSLSKVERRNSPSVVSSTRNTTRPSGTPSSS